MSRFGDSDSDESSDPSGDGSSSGESLSSNATAHPKRQKITPITTRSSTRTAAPSHNIGIIAPAVSKPTNPPSRQSADTSEVMIDADTPPSVDPPPLSTRYAPLTKTSGNTISEEPFVTDSNFEDPGSAVAKSPATNDVEDPAIVKTGVLAANPALPSSPTPTLSDVIDAVKVPEFLLSHGTGKRTVNIFAYLKRVADPHFQQVLLEYLRFENRDNTKIKVTLPAAGRPFEVSQWLARARPADLPDFTKGGRTFADFVDSAFSWWASLQPTWRTFQRSGASREVQGAWGILYAPRTNGVLSVVILVYWWAQILELDERVHDTRTDYELFAEDVAWVLSELSK